MAGADWQILSFNEKNELTDGSFTSKDKKLVVELYKNQILIWDQGKFVIRLLSGDLCYADVRIVAKRGPQDGIYCVVYELSESGDHVAMVGCGVSNYDDNGECIEVTDECRTFLQAMLNTSEIRETRYPDYRDGVEVEINNVRVSYAFEYIRHIDCWKR